MTMSITVIKGKKSRTFRKVALARAWAGRARKVQIIVTN